MHPSRCSGFTLIELAITLILIGILSSAVVMISISATAQHRVTSQADEFRRNLSHIQLLAISRGKRLRLLVSTNGYTVYDCPDAACVNPSVVTADPATGQPFTVLLTDHTTFTSSSTLDFDSLGRPQYSGRITSARNYTLSGSGRSASINVLPITGFAMIN